MALRLDAYCLARVTHTARDFGIEQSVLRRWVSREHGCVRDMRPDQPIRGESVSKVERLQRELPSRAPRAHVRS